MGSLVRNLDEYLELVSIMDEEDYALFKQREWEEELERDRRNRLAQEAS